MWRTAGNETWVGENEEMSGGRQKDIVKTLGMESVARGECFAADCS